MPVVGAGVTIRGSSGAFAKADVDQSLLLPHGSQCPDDAASAVGSVSDGDQGPADRLCVVIFGGQTSIVAAIVTGALIAVARISARNAAPPLAMERQLGLRYKRFMLHPWPKVRVALSLRDPNERHEPW